MTYCEWVSEQGNTINSWDLGEDAMRISISNLLCGGDYSAVFYLGRKKTPVNLLLDTGSSTPAIKLTDLETAGGTATDYASHLAYGSLPRGFNGPVINSSLACGQGSDQLTLNNINIVAIPPSAGNPFGKADGILGLAYKQLNQSFDLGINSFEYLFNGTGQPTKEQSVDLPTYFTELEQQGIAANRFSLYTLRSMPHVGNSDPSKDPLNRGYIILGEDERAGDLYHGDFATVKVVDDVYYNVNLINIAVGDSTIEVPATYSGTPSNSIVDSGTNSIALPKDLYNQVFAAFQALGSEYADAISSQSISSLQGWPDIVLTLEGTAGNVSLSMTPDTYWQLNTSPSGGAVFNVRPFGSPPAILGLPLLNNYYTVFDRSADQGLGVIKFAPIARAPSTATPTS